MSQAIASAWPLLTALGESCWHLRRLWQPVSECGLPYRHELQALRQSERTERPPGMPATENCGVSPQCSVADKDRALRPRVRRHGRRPGTR